MSIHAHTLNEALFHLRGMAVARPAPGKLIPGDWVSQKDPESGLYSVSVRIDTFPLEIRLSHLDEAQFGLLKGAYQTNVSTLFIHLASVQQARKTLEQLQRDIKGEMVRWYGKKRNKIIRETDQIQERRSALAKLPREKTLIKSMPSYENWEITHHEFTLSMKHAFPGYNGCRHWRDYQAKTNAVRKKMALTSTVMAGT